MTDGNDALDGRTAEDQHDLTALCEAVKAGDESGPSIPAEKVFAELRAMIADRRRAFK
jgi:antitoxin ParD1/3/4